MLTLILRCLLAYTRGFLMFFYMYLRIYVCPVIIKISHQCVTSYICLTMDYNMCLTMNYYVYSHLCSYDFACDCMYYCKGSRNYAYSLKDVCHIWAHAPEILRISFRTLVYGNFCALCVIRIYFCDSFYVILCLHVCFTIFVWIHPGVFVWWSLDVYLLL